MGADLEPKTTEKKLAILQERFTVLEQKFSRLHEKGTTTTEDTTGEVTDNSVNSVCGNPHRNTMTVTFRSQDCQLISEGHHGWSNGQ